MGAVSRPARPPEGDPGDADLLRRIRAGDRAAVAEVYERFRRPAFALARRILADDVLAEDVLQDVFLSLWRDPGGFDRERGPFSAGRRAAVHHRAVDAVRREESQRRRRARAETELGLAAPTATRDVEEEVAGRLTSGRVREALGQLPDAQREAPTLAYYGGDTPREGGGPARAPPGPGETRMRAGAG